MKSAVKKILSINRVRALLFYILIPFNVLVIYTSRTFEHDYYKLQFHRNSSYIKFKILAITHYVLYGRRRGFVPSKLFIPEYYDERNWHRSLIDPLSRYLIDKKYNLQTSPILYSGKQEAKKMLKSKKSATDNFEITIGKENKKLTWGEIEGSVMSSATTMYKQEKLRFLSRPSKKFDYKKQQRCINKYSNYVVKDNRKPLVSIITPTWNRENTIVNAIDSVKRQTFDNWELIITDDGSTDKTIQKAKESADKDERIRIIRNQHGGVCKTRNSGIKAAKGEYIAFLDSDNTWEDYYLKTAIAYMIDKNADASYSAIKMSNGNNIRYRTTLPNKELLDLGNYIDLNVLIAKKELIKAIGMFDESLRRMVDYDLAYKLSRKANFHYIPIIGVNYLDNDQDERITTTELSSWDGVVKSNNVIDWDNLKSKKRDKKLTSIILPVRNDIRTFRRCLESLINHGFGKDTELIIVDSSSNPAANLYGTLASSLRDDIKYYRVASSFDNTLGANFGYTYSKGSHIIVLDQRTTVEQGWLESLNDALKSKKSKSFVSPLILKPNRLIDNVGSEIPKGYTTFTKILENHPISDSSMFDEIIDVPLLLGGCIAFGSELFNELKGFNPLYDKGLHELELCLRAKKLHNTSFKVVRGSQIVNYNPDQGLYSSSHKLLVDELKDNLNAPENITGLWKKSGFEVVEYKPVNPNKGELSKLEPILKKIKSNGYRWSIKIAAPPDERRFGWGDKYFAESLASSLERLGQRVGIDYLGAHERPTSYLDDIILDIRGLADPKPQQGKLNIMWVISHPDKVNKKTVQSFDLVYSAGKKWAEYMGELSGENIAFLPQCTDSKLFKPTKENARFKGKTVFVGGSRNSFRPIVRDAIKADLDLNIYGGGWENFVDSKYIKAQFIPNDELTRAYGSANIVLNDHWEDMRKWGFISNRIFDVSASGGCVVSDNVHGIGEVFKQDHIKIYNSTEDLVSIKKSRWGTATIPRSKRSAVSEYTRSNHSFDARAKTLLSDAKKYLKPGN